MKTKLLIVLLAICAIANAQPTWQLNMYQINTFSYAMPDNGYVVATSGHVIYLSTADGAAFTFNQQAGTGYPASSSTYNNILAKGNLIFLADNSYPDQGRGVYMSSNFGATWTRKCNGLGADTNVVNIYLLANGALLAYTQTQTTYKIYRSTNDGGSWTFIQSMPGNVCDIKYRSATEAYMCADGDIYKSTNNGSSWTKITTSSPGIYTMAISSSGTFYGTTNTDIMKSTDNGVTWTNITTTGIPAASQPGEFLRAPGDTFYFANISPPYGIYYSTNSCVNWNPCNTGFSFAPQVFRNGLMISKGGYMFAGPSNSGIYRSVNRVTVSQVGIEEYELENSIYIYPNPFSAQTVLQTDNFLKNATLTVYNSFGQTVKEIKNISGQTVTLNRDNLPNGLYFLRLTENNKTFAVDKLVITD